MKNFYKGLLGAVAGLAAVMAFASVGYVGYNSLTGLNGQIGTTVSMGNPPTSGASTSCGTLGAITGGPSAGKIATAAVTACTVQLVIPAAAPNGVLCQVADLTHPANETIASNTTTSCTTSAMTITAGDVLTYTVEAY